MISYIALTLGAYFMSSSSLTYTSKILAEKLVSRHETDLYLGRDLPGHIIGAGISLLLIASKRSNPYKSGIYSSCLLPVSVSADYFTAKYAEDRDKQSFMLVSSGIARSTSFVTSSGTHIFCVSKMMNDLVKSSGNTVCHFGTKLAISNSLRATFGSMFALWFSSKFDQPIVFLIFSLLYPALMARSFRIIRQ